MRLGRKGGLVIRPSVTTGQSYSCEDLLNMLRYSGSHLCLYPRYMGRR